MCYDSVGFLEKNRDRLNDDAYNCVGSSSLQFLASLFNDQTATSKITLGSKFSKQLNELMSTLNATEPHYIRCVRVECCFWALSLTVSFPLLFFLW